ncbi:MAG: DinB family protein [Tetrasphaera sp.]
MPFTRERPAPQTGERETLLGWYAVQRGIIALKCAGLADDLAHRIVIPTSSMMTIAGVVAHLTWSERLWFEHEFLGIDCDGPGFDGVNDSEFAAARGEPIAAVLAAYERQCAHSDDIIAGHDLSSLARRPARVGPHRSLRWIVGHMLEETARHAGHLDLLRELLDGETSYT